jgi:uncharacterized protein YjiS (DUF1127 family)
LEILEVIMRDYEINEAQSRLAYGRLTWLVRMVGNWRMRKDLKRLQDFSDYQLRDIGLTRGDLQRLICLPLDVDMTWEAERRSLIQAKYENLSASHLASPVQGEAAQNATPHFVPTWMGGHINMADKDQWPHS